MNQEDISIVMPVYNHEDTLAEAIESALMQKMPYTSKIYCFDDASTDGSGRILQHYQKRYPDSIRLYTNPENLGCGKASYLYHRPTITGRYWCILEGDDYWTRPDKLARQISFLDAHPDYTGCSCDSVMKNEVTGETGVIRPCRNTWNLLDLLLLKHKFAFYVHTTSLVWRNIYLDKGFFLPPAYQKKGVQGDVLLMHAMLGRGGKVQNIPEVMSCYRVTGRGVWTRKSKQEQADLNESLPEAIARVISLKYRIFIRMQQMRERSNIVKRLIPGPVNE